MATPVLIDSDMGVDSAAALALALSSDALDVRAVVAVGGLVAVDQAAVNAGRVIEALAPPARPVIGRGLEAANKVDRAAMHGEDGLGDWDFTLKQPVATLPWEKAYDRAIAEAGGKLCILALGPLTNVAAHLARGDGARRGIASILVCGGAVWAKGAHDGAEANFRRDPAGAAAVLASGVNVTVAPVDVTELVCLDQSHVAHLAASGYRTGEVTARVLEHALESDGAPAYGKTFVPAAVAAAGLVWPALFMKTRMRLEVSTAGRDAGRCKPALGGDKSSQIDLLTAVNAADLLENMLESLCHEAFVV